jgi:hypothetical protein
MGMPPSCYILWSTLLYRMGMAQSCYIMWSTVQYRHGDGTILLHNVKHTTIQMWVQNYLVTHWYTPGGGCWAISSPLPHLDLKNTNFCRQESDVFCDLPFSRNQSLSPDN